MIKMNGMTKIITQKSLDLGNLNSGLKAILSAALQFFGFNPRKNYRALILCLIVFRNCQSVLQNDYNSSKTARWFHFLYITASMCCYVFFIWSLILQRTYENTRLNYYSQLFYSKALQEFHNTHFLISPKNCLVINSKHPEQAD